MQQSIAADWKSETRAPWADPRLPHDISEEGKPVESTVTRHPPPAFLRADQRGFEAGLSEPQQLKNGRS